MYHHSNNRLRQLEERVRDNDAEAAVQLQSDLERHLIYMVRYTLRSRKASSALARRILDEADRLPRAWRPDPDDEDLVQHIARQVSDDVVRRARPCAESYRPMETISA